MSNKNYTVGMYSIISEKAVIGQNVKIGNFCVIHDDVVIGNDTELKDYVELRAGTIIGDKCMIDSRVSSSGMNKIGNNVIIRYDSIIARGCDIGDDTYICPRVMTNNLDTGGHQIGGAKVEKGCFIGTNAVLQHGITLGENVIIGSMSFVNTDCESNSKYIGTPARKLEKK